MLVCVYFFGYSLSSTIFFTLQRLKQVERANGGLFKSLSRALLFILAQVAYPVLWTANFGCPSRLGTHFRSIRSFVDLRLLCSLQADN